MRGTNIAFKVPQGPQTLQDTFTILVADRNPNVRELLKRELTAKGYRVHLARSCREVLGFIDNASGTPDLLIADPDLPDGDEIPLLEVIRGLAPDLPVVIHTFLADYILHPPVPAGAAVVEKDGGQVDRLKDIVHDLLHRPGPP